MSDGPLIVLEEDGELHRLYLDSAVLGRSKSCDLAFDRQGVSRRHCELVLRPDGLFVRDLGSTHGTLANGTPVQGEAALRRGSEIRLGAKGPRIMVIEASIDGHAVPISDPEVSTSVADVHAALGPSGTQPVGRPAVAPPPVAGTASSDGGATRTASSAERAAAQAGGPVPARVTRTETMEPATAHAAPGGIPAAEAPTQVASAPAAPGFALHEGAALAAGLGIGAVAGIVVGLVGVLLFG